MYIQLPFKLQPSGAKSEIEPTRRDVGTFEVQSPLSIKCMGINDLTSLSEHAFIYSIPPKTLTGVVAGVREVRKGRLVAKWRRQE